MFEIRLGGQGEVVMSGRLDAPHVVEMGDLDYISSAGLGVLLKTQKRAMATGKGLRLVNANRHIRDIFKYAGFDRIFEIVPAAE